MRRKRAIFTNSRSNYRLYDARVLKKIKLLRIRIEAFSIYKTSTNTRR